ncbi:hypothetical protein [Photorhabdus sp. RM71S]|uniref:hypothetical protein n=1 Tax=Photorhabdus sp. RM71S TaxID=3342824 RepID=UPI0036D950DD
MTASLADHAAETDQKGCIVLSEDRTEVKVRLNQPTGAVTETWRIIREKDTHNRDIIRLQRPNGAFVMTATP